VNRPVLVLMMIQILLVGIALAAGVEAQIGTSCTWDSECDNGCNTDAGQCATSVGEDCSGGKKCWNAKGTPVQSCYSDKCGECEYDYECSAVKEEKCDTEKGVCAVPAPKLSCKNGWIELTDSDGSEDAVCVKMERPIKFISWFHMQYSCDALGGFLPEPSTTCLSKQFDLLLKGYEQLYGETMFYLGASDLSHTGTWKWSNNKEEVTTAADGWVTEPAVAENLDCMAKISTSSGKYMKVNCENDSMRTQVAFICMANKE